METAIRKSALAHTSTIFKESNLVRFEKAKNSKNYAKIVDSLDQMSKMPTEQHILDRFKCLAANVKSRQERVVIVIKEVKILWKKLNLPIQKSKSTVERKIENVLNKYEKNSRKPGTQDFTNLFNMSTNGRAGYCTTIEDTQGVHPRKLKLIKQKVSQDTKDDLNSEDEEQQRVSQDTKDDLSSKDEEHFNTEEEKQDFDSGSQDSDAPKEEEIVWRDDMAFLHHLITCYRQFKETGCFLK
ncbi:hypothetical protein HELRODRAFT_166505 [Helobdella robusta]|uniref:Uncharacterized protein n=1 Tax=Helobdella robusta TaxID=6412 RepID=T1EY69_HELRO|nr:hypothetical protein HELRODRAFT_166505 [Helobdella robusta]ESO11502.1 hypothetical protein HELRODRAFT_166505 [Helobdella robusta]